MNECPDKDAALNLQEGWLSEVQLEFCQLKDIIVLLIPAITNSFLLLVEYQYQEVVVSIYHVLLDHCEGSRKCELFYSCQFKDSSPFVGKSVSSKAAYFLNNWLIKSKNHNLP